MVLEKTLESPLDHKEIKPVNPKGKQPWIFIGRTDAEVEAPLLWPPDAKSQVIRKDPDVGKDWKQEEKEMTKEQIVGWHHWLNGYEFEQAPGDGEGQGSLVCCCYVASVVSNSVWPHRWQPIQGILQVRTLEWVAISFSVLQCIGSQRVGHDWVTEQQQQQVFLTSEPPGKLVINHSGY